VKLKINGKPLFHKWLIVFLCAGILLPGCAQDLVAHAVQSGLQARKDVAIQLERADAITVVLVGTGSPLPSKRAQACTAIFAGGKFLLFDAGDGAERSMDALNLPIADLRAVFVTHYHADHFADLGEVIDRSWINGRRDNLTIYGPQGLRQIVDGFLASYKLEYGYRTAHHGAEMMPPQYAGATVSEFQAPATDDPVIVYNQDGLVVKAFRVNHPPIVPALGYRVEYAGKIVVISGDTTATAGLLAQSRGADLLVAEVMNMDIVQAMEAASRDAGNNFNGNILRDIRGYHMDVSDVGKIAEQAQVKKLALTHLAPSIDNEGQVNSFFKQPVQKLYHGEVFVGDDGTRIVIPLK
jgi:ribonuclease Z